jgi:pSer/pThr/pTyr-binding forkhead associated (FHA) protein
MGSEARARELKPKHASLRVMGGFYAGLEVPVDRMRMVIGRGRGADLVVAESTMSREHAAIAFDEEGCFVEDLGSTNGTKVNGERSARARLRDGDEIQLGRLQLQLSLRD